MPPPVTRGLRLTLTHLLRRSDHDDHTNGHPNNHVRKVRATAPVAHSPLQHLRQGVTVHRRWHLHQVRGAQVTRNRASAKAAGSHFERVVADYLKGTLDDDRIDRRVKTGAKDRGDIAGVRIHGQRIVIECKDTARPALGTWITEAETERGNDDALAGVVAHKRHGKGQPADQLVTMTLRDFAALIGGNRALVQDN